MSAEDYRASASPVEVGTERLKKLKSIRSEGLLEACRLLEKEKRAGYQEKLLDALIWDICHGM